MQTSDFSGKKHSVFLGAHTLERVRTYSAHGRTCAHTRQVGSACACKLVWGADVFECVTSPTFVLQLVSLPAAVRLVLRRACGRERA
eukprot:530245-Pleurochrysis_carterae.AAC.1